MIRRKKLYTAAVVLLLIFFAFTIYFMCSISSYPKANKKYTTEFNIALIEHDIKLKSFNLPEEYTIKLNKNDTIIDNFLKSLKSNKEGTNFKKLWAEANKNIKDEQLFNGNCSNNGNFIKALRNARILWADTYSKGTQFKLLFKLEGDQLAVFKPKWYSKDTVITGHVYSGKDRYGSEILSFYLAGILNLPIVPIAAERVIDVKNELVPVATSTLKTTIYTKNDKTCIYGKCFYCKREEPVCEDENGKIVGALILFIPGKFRTYRSPWQRTYKKNQRAPWELHANYCMSVKPQLSSKRLLDLMDTSIFDFLIQNGDRHHYETLNDKVLLLDNGKGLGNPLVHHIDILAPLYQCCILRSSTWERLKALSGGYIRELLESIEEIKSVVSDTHIKAIEERLNLVYATVERCRMRNKFFYNA